MQPIAQSFNPLLSIVNSKKPSNNNSQLSIDNSNRVDMLVEDFAALIDPTYRLWFIKRFYKLTNDQVHRIAATVLETKAMKPDTDERRLFSWFIKREARF